MTTYQCSAAVSGGKYLGTVEADSAEAALEKAWGLDIQPSLCHQCSGECEDPEVEEIDVWNTDDFGDNASSRIETSWEYGEAEGDTPAPRRLVSAWLAGLQGVSDGK